VVGRDEREIRRRRMAWQLALGASLVAGVAHVLSLRMLFLLVGLAQAIGGTGMFAELRRGARGWGSRVALVAACTGAAYHLLMLALSALEGAAGTPQDPGFLFPSIFWGVVDPLIVVALLWGSPDGRPRARPARSPGLV